MEERQRRCCLLRTLLLSLLALLVLLVAHMDATETLGRRASSSSPSPSYESLESSSGRLMKFADEWTPQRVDGDNVYDFIIVGGGTAGCVLTRRLLEANETWRVLLLEAGDDLTDDPDVSNPANFDLLIYDAKAMWNDFAQRSESSSAPFTPLFVGTGRGLGGGSSVNALAYQRGSPTSYDQWAEMVQDDSWSYEALLPLFKRAENSSFATSNPNQRGSDGPLNVITYPTNFFQADWEAAGQKLGFPVIPDINAGVETLYGFSTEQFTIASNGSRDGTNEAYLQPILNDDSYANRLQLETHAFATEIMFSNDTEQQYQAIGVKYLLNGEEQVAYVTKEVVVSAGVMRTPVILTLSGIGDFDTMDQLNAKESAKNLKRSTSRRKAIEKKVNLPQVGLALQDQAGLALTFQHNITDANEVPLNHPCVYVNTSDTSFPTQISSGDLLISLEFEAPPSNQVTVKFFLIRNSLQGQVNVASNDPLAPPLIMLDYYSNLSVLDALVQGIRLTRQILSTSPITNTIIGEIAPGTSIQSDDDLLNWVISNLYSNSHYAGTCRMGVSGDTETSVVDSELRVQGVSGLRVADNSIMPIITTGTPYNPAVLIAEKASDLLAQAWS